MASPVARTVMWVKNGIWCRREGCAGYFPIMLSAAASVTLFCPEGLWVLVLLVLACPAGNIVPGTSRRLWKCRCLVFDPIPFPRCSDCPVLRGANQARKRTHGGMLIQVPRPNPVGWLGQSTLTPCLPPLIRRCRRLPSIPVAFCLGRPGSELSPPDPVMVHTAWSSQRPTTLV